MQPSPLDFGFASQKHLFVFCSICSAAEYSRSSQGCFAAEKKYFSRA
jgi:hypothetical protein